jgi:hypothetical protein
MPQTTFERWQSGDITPDQALDEYTQVLASLEDRIEPLTATKEAIRGYISQIVDYVGGSAKSNGYEMIITNASVTRSYDSRKLDALVAQLMADGYYEVAKKVADCGKDSSRAGGLRITKSKSQPA